MANVCGNSNYIADSVGLRRGFTLVEVLLATMMAAFVAAVSVGALRVVTGAREKVHNYTSVSEQLRYAAGVIAADIRNIYRGPTTMEGCNLRGELIPDENSPMLVISSLTVNCLTGPARVGSKESKLHQVQYYIKYEDDGRAYLMRRVEPLVGNEDEERGLKGVLTPIGDKVTGFEFNFFYDGQWYESWLEDRDFLPEIVEVRLSAIVGNEEEDAGGGSRVMKVGDGAASGQGVQGGIEIVGRNFVVSFPRLPSTIQGQGSEQGVDEQFSGKGVGNNGGGGRP